jgi:hypothetical protein
MRSAFLAGAAEEEIHLKMHYGCTQGPLACLADKIKRLGFGSWVKDAMVAQQSLSPNPKVVYPMLVPTGQD